MNYKSISRSWHIAVTSIIGLLFTVLLSTAVVALDVDDPEPMDVPGPDELLAQLTAGTGGMTVKGNSRRRLGGSPFSNDRRNWSWNDYNDFQHNNGRGVTYSGRDYRWWRNNGRPSPFGNRSLRFSFHRNRGNWHRRDAI